MATGRKQPDGNRALRMLGLPALPKKLPSRNWMIFWTVLTATSAAIIYDRREKRRATARWAHAVSHLSKEPLSNPSAMPRKLTIYIEAPPGDGLRVAQDHFAEYAKPILASSGLDWEFVQGRRQGDIRAVVAERIRRGRRAVEPGLGGKSPSPAEQDAPTDEDVVEATRRRNRIPEFDGTKGDIVLGRHTWKEYVRGLHEGWLGPLTPPSEPSKPELAPKEDGEQAATKEGEEKSIAAAEESKPAHPPQPKPYNTIDQYPSSPIPLLMPAELTPAAPIRFPHILGFLNTPTRTRRFFGRRYLADEIGREVAAVCLCTYRDFREAPPSGTEAENEVQGALAFEERDWLKSVWKADEDTADGKDTDDGASHTAASKAVGDKPERIWASPVALDPRISARMRKFELRPEDEALARQIVVPEEEIEGWIKGKFRQLWRWSVGKASGADRPQVPNVGYVDED